VDDYPQMIVRANLVEPAPRRVRATLSGRTIFDTTRALYLWESPSYPQYYVPLEDVHGDALVDEGHEAKALRGTTRLLGLRVGEVVRRSAARLFTESPIEGLAGTVRFEWSALDSWFEEDEEIFVHPRSPYVRCDALRSTRRVRVTLDDVVLAESSSPVMLFETGLPTRYYLNRTEVNFDHLEATDTVTACPYKGTTTGYWSIRTGAQTYPDLAWSYDFPTRQVLPIAGLIAFYNEKVDISVDGVLLHRPVTQFFAPS
jgi:uncharacterized protein (DUF427 family)